MRQRAHAELRGNAQAQGNGVLAHVNFSQMFEREGEQPAEAISWPPYRRRHHGRCAARACRFQHDIKMVVDMHAGGTPLTGTTPHHQSYASNEPKGAI